MMASWNEGGRPLESFNPAHLRLYAIMFLRDWIMLRRFRDV